MKLPSLFQALANRRFARLYLAQTVNLVGDALTWLGLALLAFELAGERSAEVLAIALTLRVTAFVICAPVGGVLADQVDRKRIMVITHLCRCGLICLLPWVNQVWQIYAIVLGLNIFGAFFTPTHTATIPLVTTAADRGPAMALTTATSQLLGVLGPGVAGSVVAWVGTRQVFWLDGMTFLVAALIILSLPGTLQVERDRAKRDGHAMKNIATTLREMRTGSLCLWADRPMRYALTMQFITSIAGAAILINSVRYVRGTLQLGEAEYGWVMAALGLGVTTAAIGLGNLLQVRQYGDRSPSDRIQNERSPSEQSHSVRQMQWISLGAVLTTLAILPTHRAQLTLLLVLWAVAGMGQTAVNLVTQMLIADRVGVDLQGRVYGAHLAWSHLGWAVAYPLAGWLGTRMPEVSFFYSGILGLILCVGLIPLVTPWRRRDRQPGYWHEHGHMHDISSTAAALDWDGHQHLHNAEISHNAETSERIANHTTVFHQHLHFHPNHRLSQVS